MHVPNARRICVHPFVMWALTFAILMQRALSTPTRQVEEALRGRGFLVFRIHVPGPTWSW